MLFFAAKLFSTELIAQVQQTVLRRLLRAFVERSYIDCADAKTMQSYAHGGGQANRVAQKHRWQARALDRPNTAGIHRKNRCLGATASAAPASVLRSTGPEWLIARVYEIELLKCLDCGGQMTIIAFVMQASEIKKVLEHVGQPKRPRQPLHAAHRKQICGVKTAPMQTLRLRISRCSGRQ